MTQLSGNQFEDDLTVGLEESNGFSTDSIDMFGITGDDDSPIARLKTIILSIDWEINDEILQQLDDELLDLGEIWAGDKIKQVYVQGLSKIGKYIFKERAGAHPDAIKLLLTFYHNLETIVNSDDSMGEEEKKQLLVSDVRKFDQLKGFIEQSLSPSEPAAVVDSAKTASSAVAGASAKNINELKGLKAQILGIDWEINDLELEKLGAEVKRLEALFANDRPKLILLQGIGALSSYINKMRSKSSATSFVLLRSFNEVLEQISGNALPASEQKQLLLAEVSKFKDFKAEISSGAPAAELEASREGKGAGPSSPAVEEASPASMSVTEAMTEEIDSPDEEDVSADVSSRLSSVFGEDDFDSSGEYRDSEKNRALEGVNVETEADDDSDEEALPYEDGGISPALAEMDEDSSFSVEKLADDLSVAPPTVAPEAIVGDDIEVEDDLLNMVDVGDVEKEESVLTGVDVETEADDDSDEESLPMSVNGLAPALSGADDGGGFNADSLASDFDESASEAIESRLGDFFDDEVAASSEGWGAELEEELIEEDDETPGDENGLIAALSEAFDEQEEETAVESEHILVAADESLDADDSMVSALSAFDDDREESIEQALDFNDEVVEDGGGFVAALSDFDDEDDAEHTFDLAEESPENEGSLVAALSQFDDDGDDVVGKMEDTDDESVTEVLSDSVSENMADIEEAMSVESTEELDEPVAEPELQFFEEETPAPSLFETADELAIEDEVELEIEAEAEVEEAVADGLAFLDDEVDVSVSHELDVEDVLPPVVEDAPEEEIAFEVESDDLSDDSEIEFTVPGTEIGESPTITDATIGKEDLIDFDVPGEGDEEVATFMPDEGETSEEVIFEPVADDVALDLLPDEEFDDSEPLAADTEIVEEEDIEQPEDKIESVPVSDTGKYESLAILSAALEKNVAEDGIQDLLVELNKIHSDTETSYTDKTFLQLLASVCQYLEKNQSSDDGVALMQEIVSGLQMCDSSDVSSGRVQESLFASTSRLLVLQREEMDSLVSGSAQEQDLQPDTKLDTVDEVQEEPDSEQTSLRDLADEQLAFFVKKELADIRKELFDEIGSLRKKMAGK